MVEVSDAAFEKIKNAMHKKTGVFLKPTKKPLIIARLRKRLATLNLSTFDEYASFLEKDKNEINE